MSTETDTKARDIGWRPQEEFRGDPEKWVDSEEYLRRGEEILPLVKATNKRLEGQVTTLAGEIARLTAALAEQQASMTEFATFNQEQLADKLAEQKRNLTRELREARTAEDDNRIEDIEERLEENREARATLKAIPPAPPAPASTPTPPVAPEFAAWQAANPWYGGDSEEDVAKTGAAQAFGIKAAAEGKKGQAFFDAVDAKLAKVYPTQRKAEASEEGRPSGGSGGTGSADNSFNSLPAEAKSKAKEQAAKFVGPNKMFKDEKAWFSYYAKQYRTSEAA